MDITIGLFGSCYNTDWRDSFIDEYEQRDINYFNPQLNEWCADDRVDIEAHHLVNDEIILFPITSKSFGLGSLAEIGFIVYQVTQSILARHVIIMIDDHIEQSCINSNAMAANESLRVRALVKAHLKKIPNSNYIHFVNSLDEMLTLSLTIYENFDIVKR